MKDNEANSPMIRLWAGLLMTSSIKLDKTIPEFTAPSPVC